MPAAGWLCHTMRLILLSMLLFALIGARVAGAAGGDLLWQVIDAQDGKQEATAAVSDDQGNLIVTGYQYFPGGDDEFWTVKFTRDGTVAWQAPFAGGAGKAMALAVDGNRDVIVVGYVWNGISRDIQTVKYSGATGLVLWQHALDGAVHGSDVGTSVAVDSLNNVYVGGNSQNGAGKDAYLLVKYAASGPDLSGNPLWQKTWNSGANGPDQLAALAVGSDGVASSVRARSRCCRSGCSASTCSE